MFDSDVFEKVFVDLNLSVSKLSHRVLLIPIRSFEYSTLRAKRSRVDNAVANQLSFVKVEFTPLTKWPSAMRATLTFAFPIKLGLEGIP